MDKRSLTFLVSVLLSYVVIQFGFQYFDAKNAQSQRQEQLALEAKQQKELKASIHERTASLESMPIRQLYLSEKLTDHVIGTAIGEEVIALPWELPLPETVFIKSENGPQALNLLKQPENSETPALYSKNPSPKLSSLPIYKKGIFDLQLVTTGKEPTVYLGSYSEGHFTFPAKELKLSSEDIANYIPLQNALVFFKTREEGFVPIGTFSAKSQKITLFADAKGLQLYLDKTATQKFTEDTSEEKLFVLENSLVQLVISSKGGAIKEANLPFHSGSHPNSVVKEIEYDREMVESAPQNARFPSGEYFLPPQQAGQTPLKQNEGALGGYYPLLRRDLILNYPQRSIKVPPQYYALNTVSEYPEVAEQNYTVKSFDASHITLESNQPHRRIEKTYRLANEGAPYVVEFDLDVEGDTRGLFLTSGVPEVELISGSPAPALKYRITRGSTSEVESLSLPEQFFINTSFYPDWVCNSNGFFGLILDPLSTIDPGLKAVSVSAETVPTKLAALSVVEPSLTPFSYTGYQMLLPLKASGAPLKFRLYAGPFSGDTLAAVDKHFTDPATGKNPDYAAAQSFHGWFKVISEPFSKLLFFLMKLFYSFTGSWGFSIILLTVALRIMLYPLNAWSLKSMLQNQQVAPEINALREKYKNDKQKMNIEMMNLYKEKGINPLSGCLPLLIQMPFLIGMFDLLKSAFELRGASFIPGWIDNLTSPDVLFSWQTPIPFIGNQFHLLPFLLGGVMFVQQKFMSSAPTNPDEMTPEQRQQQAMGTMMTLMFTVLFYHFPSGLNIYWLSSMSLGILQQWYMKRNMEAKLPETPPEPKKNLPKRKKART